MKRFSTSILGLLATVSLASQARGDTPGRHPSYLHALTDLRAARANLERPSNFAPRGEAWDEHVAVAEIDAALDEIKRAAIWDGKPLSDHPPIDTQLDWRGRIHQSLELLHKADQDISQAEDNGVVRGLQHRAQEHIAAAIRFVEEGQRRMHFDQVAYAPPPVEPVRPVMPVQPVQPMPPAQHPAYLHALSDLRTARAHLERPSNFSGRGENWDEHAAVAEIDAAIDEIKRAAIWDGKPLSDHPPMDARLDWRGRLRQSIELLHSAERDISQEEDNAQVQGLQHRAQEHIHGAIRFVEEGQRRMHFERVERIER